MDVNTLHRDQTATALKLNELGRITLRTQAPLMIDEYGRNASTGSFILIDPATNGTVAAGMVLRDRSERDTNARAASPNAVGSEPLLTTAHRRSRGCTVWFTGWSGWGRSSMAVLTERMLLATGQPGYVLDGDTLRHGLNADLGLGMADRAENLRRLVHVAALLAGCGQIVLVPAAAPLTRHRDLARRVHDQADLPFYEILCDIPLEERAQQCANGRYGQARMGEMHDLTSVEGSYELPDAPDLRMAPGATREEIAQQIVDFVLWHR